MSMPGIEPAPLAAPFAGEGPGLEGPRLDDPGLADPGLADPGLADPGLADPGLADPAPPAGAALIAPGAGVGKRKSLSMS
jgi:hypothetical protein